MINLELWFPEDFDKRYAKYREDHVENKMPEPFFSERLQNERKNILSIKTEDDFRNEIEKWSPLKTIIDAIHKDLSPFLPSSAQVINIDLTKLGISEKEAGHILMMLAYERICRWKINKSSAVISTEALAGYLGGNGIVIPDYDKFQGFRKEVMDFYEFLEDQRNQKFPKSNAAKAENVKNNKQESAADSDVIDETVKRVAVWGGETVSDLPLITYNEVTGKGEVIGKKKFKFKDGSPEYKIFNMLYAKLAKKTAKLERQDVLIAGGFYKDYEEPDPTRKTNETAFINEVAKSIREKTGLDTEELVNNNGSLTLLVLRQDKNPPKVTKFVPVWG
ncbi:hypothetical protein KGQ27_00135 [Patescibacteria group bacterium]|nr:hypothetical protein [Patescibacteria group bacterium]MDE1946625.1 hypothetical protein [Patescibacteria group bacterium]MDE2010579.1 hypothetical protein [Patescibacteria group bacterium]MDE2233167.1 hypothetical protein [Patescibacteria group bacterium]